MLKTLTNSEEWTLTALDRCDFDCASQAYVRAVGDAGELLFCSHHYNKISSNSKSYEGLMKFAYQVVDERERLIENRLQGLN
jgi:hypothetical protein